MNFRDLYQKDINREINPAVSADDMTDATIATEIGEYVFTDEIINGLGDVIGGIKSSTKSHNGIWVSGYFGSGKSHFMKFTDYCLSAQHGAEARKRVEEAVAKRDPLTVADSKSTVTVAEWNGIKQWLDAADVETILFNIGAVHNNNASQDQVFIDVFWNQFNKMRGYNEFSVPLAQLVELPLDKAGKFEAFKQKLAEDGFDWRRDAYQLSIMELDTVLDYAKELLPSLSTDAIRERLTKNDMVLSVNTFLAELQKYIQDKPKDYRLVFCADEVSQFIDGRPTLLLQLQEIVTGFHNACGGKVWLVCTAQQDLSEMLDACHINQASDDFGKIKGRFQIKVSLKGTNVDFITKKRILEKKPAAELDLRERYKKIQAAIPAQYQLPVGYESYADETAYVDAYPFVAYQFKLVGQVFNAFRNRDFVDREVKDSARSVLNVTFRVAKETQNIEVGQFISFDQFFNTMFKGSLTAIGQRSLKNADDIAAAYPANPEFAHRVVNVLFMICNLGEAEKQTFPATVDNVTTLLLRDLDTPKLSLKHEVEDVTKFLCDKNVLQVIPAKGTIAETFQFYTEDEIEVATAIKNKTVDTSTMAQELQGVIFRALNTPLAKESFHTGRFSVGVDILGRHFLSNNAAVGVSFLVDANGESKDAIRLKNADNSLCFFLAEQYAADHAFKNAFNWFCQAQIYLRDTPAANETRSKTNRRFAEKASELLREKIEPAVRKFLESCPVLSGTGELNLAAEKSADRYRKAMTQHLSHLYSHAAEVDTFPSDAKTLAEKIKRPIADGEYGPLNPKTDAETSVENYLNVQMPDLAVTDVVDHFKKVPYGWDECCTLYTLNELVRRGVRDFAYHGVAGVQTAVLADKLAKDTAYFSIRKKSAIPDATINAFVAGWKKIFGPTVFGGPVSRTPVELVRNAKDLLEAELKKNQDALANGAGAYVFATPLKEESAAFETWKGEADEAKFFETVASVADNAATRRNQTNQIRDFISGQLDKFETSVIAFAATNTSNAQFLDAEQKAAFAKLAAAKDDPTPYTNLPAYLKIAKAEAAQFDKIRVEKRAKIDADYGACFDQLESFAASKNVPRTAFADRAETLSVFKHSDDLMALENRLNTLGVFRTEQMQAIIAAIPKTPAKAGEPQKPVPCIVHLKTQTATPLANEADVDAYLAEFKKTLMASIAAGKEVIVD